MYILQILCIYIYIIHIIHIIHIINIYMCVCIFSHTAKAYVVPVCVSNVFFYMVMVDAMLCSDSSTYIYTYIEDR